MEDALRRSGTHFVIDQQAEKRVDDSKSDRETLVKTGNKRPYSENNDTKPSSPKQKHLCTTKQESVITNIEGSSMGPDSRASSSSRKEQDDQLESARAEMGEVREENQRLKMYLDRIMKDYKTLQLQFHNIMHQDHAKKINTEETSVSIDHEQEMEEPEFVSLSLGRFSSDSKKGTEKNKITSSQAKDEHMEQVKEGLSLGLDCKFEGSKSSDANDQTLASNPSPGTSFEESKEVEPHEETTWPPSKVLKTMKTGDDEILQQNPVKKARVSVRARCDTPTMNDGCQWRKYGQKIAKGNPCPRAYYRCTVAPSCPVRKQVQRCAEDMSILITTYEGTHNHPLSMSATAMASTTSAAASMLLSGSSSSTSRLGGSNGTTSANLHGLNFYLSDQNSKSRQFYLPNSSLSASPSCPTITLDLTTTAPSSSSSQYFNGFTSSYPAPRYSSTSLNFSSSESNSMTWNNGLLSYGGGTSTTTHQVPYRGGTYQSYMQKNNNSSNPNSLQADTIAAATKAITADPSFQSALAAALTSIIGTNNNVGGGGASQVGGGDINIGQKQVSKTKWGGDHQFPVVSSYSQLQTVKGNIACASSYLNKSPISSSTNSQPASLNFLPPSLPFPTSKSASASPDGNREDQTVD